MTVPIDVISRALKDIGALEAAIAGASDVPALIAVVTTQNWPRSE